MSEINHKTVQHVALLSRLELTGSEMDLYSSQLASILSYINKLNELNTDSVEPTSHVLSSLKNVFRKDIPKGSLAVEDALRNAPDSEGEFFRIPKVIEGK